MDIRLDGNEIRIQLCSIDDCNDIMSDGGYYFVRDLAERYKASLLNQADNHSKYVEWWNGVIVPKLLDMELSDDNFDWKWGQLVRQEFRMWIRLDKPVGMDEITWISDRRGFDEMQRNVLVEGLQLMGLYSEIPTLYRDSIVDSDACAKKMEVLSQIESIHVE